VSLIAPEAMAKQIQLRFGEDSSSGVAPVVDAFNTAVTQNLIDLTLTEALAYCQD